MISQITKSIGSFQTGSRDEEWENGFVQDLLLPAELVPVPGMGRKDFRPWPVFGGYLRVGCSPCSYLTAEASDDIQVYICDLDQLGGGLGVWPQRLGTVGVWMGKNRLRL